MTNFYHFMNLVALLFTLSFIVKDPATTEINTYGHTLSLHDALPILFSANARDNRRYGRWDASDEEIWEAARTANAESFLKALPQGLDTYLGEDGTRLSGDRKSTRLNSSH